MKADSSELILSYIFTLKEKLYVTDKHIKSNSIFTINTLQAKDLSVTVFGPTKTVIIYEGKLGKKVFYKEKDPIIIYGYCPDSKIKKYYLNNFV